MNKNKHTYIYMTKIYEVQEKQKSHYVPWPSHTD